MNPSPLLMRHFTQALEGIGALKSFNPTIVRVDKPEDVVTEVGYRHHLSDRVWWVRIQPSDNTGYRPGRVLVEVTYEWARFEGNFHAKQVRSIVTDRHLFANPIRAAEYVASLFGYTQPVECLC